MFAVCTLKSGRQELQEIHDLWEFTAPFFHFPHFSLTSPQVSRRPISRKIQRVAKNEFSVWIRWDGILTPDSCGRGVVGAIGAKAPPTPRTLFSILGTPISHSFKSTLNLRL